MYLVAAEPSGEVPEHQAIAFEMIDVRLDTVSLMFLLWMGLTPSPPLARDVNVEKECALTAKVTPFG